jgi:hypothetical protein
MTPNMVRQIEIGGKTYQLRFDHNAAADIDEKAPVSFKQLFERDMDYAGARLMLWAALNLVGQFCRPTDVTVGEGKDARPGDGQSLDDLYAVLIDAAIVGGVLKRPKVNPPPAGSDSPTTSLPTTETTGEASASS